LAGEARALSLPVVYESAAASTYDQSVVDDHRIVGKIGRVTGDIAPGTVGEVMLPVRGGTEAFFAYAAENGECIEAGVRVIVIEYEPPRTVMVSRYE
jgi:hypothetical protein